MKDRPPSRIAVQNTATARPPADRDAPRPAVGRLSVSVPRALHSAPLRIDDEAGLRAVSGTLGADDPDGSADALVKVALLLGGSRRDDWIVHDGRLLSFASFEGSDFRRVTGDDVTVHDPRALADDPTVPEPLVARLLHRTLRGTLDARRVAWHAAREAFRFMPCAEGDRERHERWEDDGARELCTYLGKGRHGADLDVASHTHLAFTAAFGREDGLWHCDVGAGWLYTDDLFRESDEAVSPGEARRRRDAAVGAREALGFLAHFLADDPSPPDTSVKFGDLEAARSLPSTPIGAVRAASGADDRAG